MSVWYKDQLIVPSKWAFEDLTDDQIRRLFPRLLGELWQSGVINSFQVTEIFGDGTVTTYPPPKPSKE